MAAALTDYFQQDCDEATYKFILASVMAACERADLVEGLAQLMSRNKSDPQVTADLLAAAGWTSAVAALRKGRISVRRGDFAEVLAAEAAEALDEMVVPVRKLRYQIDPNQTLPGSDVVAFAFDDGDSIDDLEFIESKYRTIPHVDLAVDAHEQLAADREGGYATTLNFLANRLRETDADLYGAFMEFLRRRDVRDSRHTVVLAFERENWDDEIVANLDDLPEHLPELFLRVFPLEDAVQLIEDVYAKLVWDVLDDE
jgi:hypothetical protein